MFEVILKEAFLNENREYTKVLSFDGLCTNIDYRDEKICRFYNSNGVSDRNLAFVPYGNILYIRNVSYKAVKGEEKV